MNPPQVPFWRVFRDRDSCAGMCKSIRWIGISACGGGNVAVTATLIVYCFRYRSYPFCVYCRPDSWSSV